MDNQDNFSWLTDPGSPDPTGTEMQVCPFCQQSYQRGTYLREHMKLCQARDRGHSVCPLCGYSTPYRTQMERHMALHAQVKEKVGTRAVIHVFNWVQHKDWWTDQFYLIFWGVSYRILCLTLTWKTGSLNVHSVEKLLNTNIILRSIYAFIVVRIMCFLIHIINKKSQYKYTQNHVIIASETVTNYSIALKKKS